MKRTLSALSLSAMSTSSIPKQALIQSQADENQAFAHGLISLFNDYIYGRHSNYRKWSLGDMVRPEDEPLNVAERAWRRKYKDMSLWVKKQLSSNFHFLITDL
jgi:hypothetical protein